MALIAIRAQLSGMHILRSMTAAAGHGKTLLADHRGMARMTVDFGMRAREHELGVATVIEFCFSPGTRIVALAAFGAHSRHVRIVGSMTPIASFRNRILHSAGLVTAKAIRVGVRT